MFVFKSILLNIIIGEIDNQTCVYTAKIFVKFLKKICQKFFNYSLIKSFVHIISFNVHGIIFLIISKYKNEIEHEQKHPVYK